MSEKLLHYIWQYKLYNPSALQTDTGEKIEVIVLDAVGNVVVGVPYSMEETPRF